MNAATAHTRNVELVAPAGNLQKLKVAIAFGADGVYLAGQRLGLRVRADNFTRDELAAGIRYAHERAVRVHVLMNVLPHGEHLSDMRDDLEFIAPLEPDAVVVSDIGALEIAREVAPELPVHISTQANVTNWRTAKAWERAGASRIILARELSLAEIAEIASRVDIGIEIFVHGAMCMAYSGRCFMSKHFLGRDSNLGDCAQPCRWTYTVVEEKRPGEPICVETGPEGTLIFSPRDLCMIEHLPEIIASGVKALKIEGRVKTAYYAGIATRMYRKALDAYHADPGSYATDPSWIKELRKTSNREFTTGFYLGEMQEGLTPPGGADRGSTYSFIGLVVEDEAGSPRVEVRGRIQKGDVIECIQPNGNDFEYPVESMLDEEGNAVHVAQPNQIIVLPDFNAQSFTLLRMPAA